MNATHGYLDLVHHRLRISKPNASLFFYREKLGMTLISECADGEKKHFFLGFTGLDYNKSVQTGEPCLPWQPLCFLELIYDPAYSPADIPQQPGLSEGYWKIAISVKDVDIARRRLIANDVTVGATFQVPDVAYLCHLDDPDGYCIELIQHSFLLNHKPEPENHLYKLGNPPTFSLITYRIKEPQRSLAFYCELLGMRLLSEQVIKEYGFTLYFLACTDELPPDPDITAIGNRDWLWQRPYTVLELQHIWGTENQDGVAYQVRPESGFEGISFVTNRLSDLLKELKRKDQNVTVNPDPVLHLTTASVLDPDGYSIRLIDKS